MNDLIENKLMTIEETCAYLSVTKGNLATMRYEGRGPKYTAPSPKMIRYRRHDIDAWLDAAVRESTAA